MPADPLGIPSDYVEGYSKALEVNAARATNYIAHTRIGDPIADALMKDLSAMKRLEADALLETALNDPDVRDRQDLPQSLHEFIRESETVPEWVDFAEFMPAYHLFHRDSYLAIAALTGGTLVEGFSTNIARSFFITGRVRDQGVRRLQQNNRHMIEILLPAGLSLRGDGWKLSVRLRLVHARVRLLLEGSDEWDHDSWGTPLCAAHLGFSVIAFSARMLRHMKSLGSRYSVEERDSFMAVWRYTAYLMGIPETILFQDFDDAEEMFDVARICEPPPSLDSVAMAHALINSAPLVMGKLDPEERQNFAKNVFMVSRAMIGNSLADSLNFPKGRAFGVLSLFRMYRRLQSVAPKLIPSGSMPSSFMSFKNLLDISALDEIGISYRLPDHVYAEESTDW